MNVKLITAPASEPITLAELKLHLRLDTGTFADNLTTYQSLAPGSHAIADNYTTHVGTGIDVLGHDVVVNLNSGTNGAGGTNDTKIQESDQLATGYIDWTGGAFTQVTEANDNAIQELSYTGSKQYIRTVSKVLVAACVFGTEVIIDEATADDEDDLNDAITEGRERVEKETGRALFTQTWDYYLDAFPSDDFIKLPFGNLASVTHVKYTDSGGNETTLTEDTDYIVETNGEKIGRVVLPYGVSWPSFTAYPSNPIVIRFVCGWNDVDDIPKQLKRAVKFAAEDSYYHGDRRDDLKPAIDSLILNYTLWDEF